MNFKVLRKVSAVLVTTALLNIPAAVFATDISKATASATNMAEKAASMVEQLNINTASIDALSSIPGIGPAIAEAIGKYRDAHGAFSSLADLVNVEGIDADLLEKIKPYLSI